VKRALPGLVFHRPYLGALPHSAYREGDLKIVVHWQTGGKELFDLRTDIGETRNLAETMPEQARALAETLSNYLASVNAETFDDRPKKARKNKAKP
jgi:hypothetical protein